MLGSTTPLSSTHTLAPEQAEDALKMGPPNAAHTEPFVSLDLHVFISVFLGLHFKRRTPHTPRACDMSWSQSQIGDEIPSSQSNGKALPTLAWEEKKWFHMDFPIWTSACGRGVEGDTGRCQHSQVTEQSGCQLSSH